MQQFSDNGAKLPLMAFLGLLGSGLTGRSARPALMPQAFIAAMSGFTPTMFITRVRL